MDVMFIRDPDKGLMKALAEGGHRLCILKDMFHTKDVSKLFRNLFFWTSSVAMFSSINQAAVAEFSKFTEL
ncbi:hypothetical protein RHMOL_Rhmol05G0204900 [Rhododendron molle]|uniref:Uncharacterized protein n=1 Tax=Rhododendron molle TaxID=49168 RepID=A0ACC0NRF8_RHOML|nr:hypothetical protein RHMOL_Rhmol05G0204900 [Rhododendron molle]